MSASDQSVVIKRSSLKELADMGSEMRQIADRVDRIFWDVKSSDAKPQDDRRYRDTYEMLFQIRQSLNDLRDRKSIDIQKDVEEIDRIAMMANQAIGLLMTQPNEMVAS